ncbi:hypothetical protein [Streptomyces beijiangensis]|uniref:CU044_5270 family protein n=1 Tax=Streptomyces beijiangensis TaxID=163361 RepID=A0A939JH01_9ACTN|nr:hypothetical protein [Streptomyces beijiangensis]MBO0511640.1 hypothetical protein [Streptomyces beijiangensis]
MSIDELDLDLPGMHMLTAAGAVAPPSAAAVAGARAAVRAAVERASVPSTEPTAAPGRRWVLRPRRRLVIAAVVAAVATGVAVLPVVDFGGAEPSASAQAATYLNQAADQVASGTFHKGTYWKTTVAFKLKNNPEVSVDTVVSRSGFGAFDSEGHFLRAKKPSHGQASWGGDVHPVTWDELDRLPLGTKALQTRLTSKQGASATFDNVSTLLSGAPVRPQLRAALYRVLAQLPGIRLEGTAKDSRGRTGTVVSFTFKERYNTYRETERMWIDSRTGDILQSTYSYPGYVHRATPVFQGWVNPSKR